MRLLIILCIQITFISIYQTFTIFINRKLLKEDNDEYETKKTKHKTIYTNRPAHSDLVPGSKMLLPNDILRSIY